MSPEPRPLTPKQARFVEQYLVDLNASQAAIRAGYSPKAARSVASRLLTNANVAAAVAEGRAKQTAKAEMTAEEWRARIARAARADVRNVVDPNTGSLIPLHELDDLGAAAIAGVKVRRLKTTIKGEGETVEEYVVEVKLVDRARYMEMAGKNLGELKERVELENVGPLFALPVGCFPDMGGGPVPDAAKAAKED